MNFSELLSTPELRALKAGKDEHPFTYCMQTVVPAMAEKGKAPEDPEAFCGWWKAEHASEHEEARHLHVLAGGTPRIAKLHGRDHLVIPVVALMEGVIHAVNAETPEFVPVDTIRRAAHTWNGRPLVVYHPNKNGKQISANHPEVIQRQCFGQIFESKVNGTRLGMEAWVDPRRLEDLGEHELLASIRAGKAIEVSVGAYVKTAPKNGFHNGRAYTAEWTEATGDHLAFLPRGRGACSLEMGCGAHRAAEETPILYTLEGAEPEVLDLNASISIQALDAQSFLKWLSEHEEEFRAAIGARNSSSDAKVIQSMHDSAVALGASCDRSNYKLMESRIKNEGGKWVVYSQDGSRRLSSHDTKAEAETQEKLIEAARERRNRELAGKSGEEKPTGCKCQH